MTHPTVSRLSVKLRAREIPPGYPRAVVPVFQRFIQDDRLPEEILIDVADYSHLAVGPGVVLVGHEIHIGLDQGDGDLGLLVRRAPRAPGTAALELRSVWDRAELVAAFLEAETPLRFLADAVLVGFPDRLNAEDNPETVEQLRAVVAEVAGERAGGGRVDRVPSTGGPLTFRVSFPA